MSSASWSPELLDDLSFKADDGADETPRAILDDDDLEAAAAPDDPDDDVAEYCEASSAPLNAASVLTARPGLTATGGAAESLVPVGSGGSTISERSRPSKCGGAGGPCADRSAVAMACSNVASTYWSTSGTVSIQCSNCSKLSRPSRFQSDVSNARSATSSFVHASQRCADRKLDATVCRRCCCCSLWWCAVSSSLESEARCSKRGLGLDGVGRCRNRCAATPTGCGSRFASTSDRSSVSTTTVASSSSSASAVLAVVPPVELFGATKRWSREPRVWSASTCLNVSRGIWLTIFWSSAFQT
mmetsp:Transcript_23179/g.91963  ORF Transcript_23179/g.91963 Transcript_23179/m.91963 type:complete len:301 (-) Transcript_23179:489-1391(-)